MLEILVLLAVCLVPTTSILCEGDTDLKDVQAYTEEMDRDMGDLDYWRTAQQNFQVFGKFDGDPSKSVIKADYYTADNQLIYGLTVDCGKKKWSTEVTNPKVADKDVVKHWLKGDLATECVSGAIFDIWFKIHQPKSMSWIFNGQALQFETQTTHFKHGNWIATRTRPLNVPTKYGSNSGKYFKVKATGAAKFTRLTWGQCMSWPKSIQENCQSARLWVQARSKMGTTVQPVGGLGKFGSNWQIFAPRCFLGSKYYDWLQSTVHANRNSLGRQMCCCVDMVTGEPVEVSGDEGSCVMAKIPTEQGFKCDRSCLEHAKKDLIEEVMAEQDAETHTDSLL